jgi:hypothetical protein
MLVPRARQRENAGHCSPFGADGGNRVRFSSEMLRLTAACCGNEKGKCSSSSSSTSLLWLIKRFQAAVDLQ